MIDMIEEVLHNINNMDDMKKMLSDNQWRKEFATVKIKLQRQSGHTYTAANLAIRNRDSLIVVNKHIDKKSMLIRYPELKTGDIIILDQIEDLLPTKEYEMVIMDDMMSMIIRPRIQYFIDNIIVPRCKLYVELG